MFPYPRGQLGCSKWLNKLVSMITWLMGHLAQEA